MMMRIFALAASAALLLTAGCGGGDVAEPLAVDDASVSISTLREQAAHRMNRVSRGAARFAPEMISAAQSLLAQSQQAGDGPEGRALLAEADALLRNAEAVAAVVAEERTLRFPADRSLGQLSVRDWDSRNWRQGQEARGPIEIPPANAVSLALAADFSASDLDALVALGPGAIQYLMIGATQLQAGDLARLGELAGLRDISLSESPFGDAAVPYLLACRALRHVNLLATSVTDDGIAQLKGLPALEELVIGDNPALSDRLLFISAQLPNLKALIVRGAALSDVGVHYIAQAPGLERLWISGKAVTDFSVETLSQLTGLNELVLLRTSISPAGQRQLQRVLTDCKIDFVS